MDQQLFTEWQSNFSVGNALLDNQHKRLLDLCKRAIQCMDLEGHEGVAQFHHVLNELSDYVKEHFQIEEEMLRACAYPLYEKHKKEHLDYQLRLTDFLLSAMLGECDKAGLIKYLSTWWSEHILHSDKLYTQFIREC